MIQPHTIMVGAGIARPNYVYDTIQPKRIVPTEKGRAMPAPTDKLLQMVIRTPARYWGFLF